LGLGFVQAQSNSAYQVVDDAVMKLGSFDSLNMGTIANIITKNCSTKELKARAIYTWIATHISYDIKAGKRNDMTKTNSTDILKSRKAIGAGYAALFQDMCSSANIRCLTVDGFIKKNTDEINEKNLKSTIAGQLYSWGKARIPGFT
jgi:transglutaminase/protease-like cytokinesis protein 3